MSNQLLDQQQALSDTCIQSHTTHMPQVSPSFALHLLDATPSTSTAAESAAIVASVVQRLVEVLSYRSAAECHEGIVEEAESRQRAIWEAEFQTFERQQRLAQQQRYRSGQSRFNLTRHISMPTINKFCDVQAGCARSEQSSQCQTQRLQPDASTATASATDGGTGLSPGRSCANPVQHQLPVPYIRVPCNNIEVPASGLLPEVPSLAGLVSKSLLRNSKSSSSSNPYRSPYTRSNSTGSTKSAKRRVSDLGNAVPKAYQPVLGLAAKAKAASQSASALSRAAVSPEQQQAVAAARVKAGVIERSMGSTLNHSTSVATCSAGLGAQASSSRTSKESNKLALVKCPNPQKTLGISRSATFTSSSPSSYQPMLLNAPASPRAWQPCKDSKQGFYPQPSPSMVLANGAPSMLHKKVLELMRRQSDTIKWEQKHNRGTVIA